MGVTSTLRFLSENGVRPEIAIPNDFSFLIIDSRGGWQLARRHKVRKPAIRHRFIQAEWNLHAVGNEVMNDVSRQSHWENVYATKGENEVSWFQETPALSLELIRLVGAIQNSAIIDIGGGASRLADCLISQGYQDVTVLDLSAAALAAARSRIGDQANQMTWITADVTTWEPSRPYDVWHDRAAFHFLTDPKDQNAYVARLRHGLRLGGHAIIGTFALDGPERCSGLAVSRHDAGSLAVTLGSAFKLIDTRRHEHITPWGTSQQFQFSTFRRAQDG